MTGTSDAQSVEVRRYFEVPRRRWRIVLLVALVGIAGFAAYAQLGSSSYEASAIVRVNPIGADPFSSGRTADQLVNTDSEAQTARSADVAERLAELLRSPDDANAVRDRMSVTASSDTASLTLTYTADTRQEARDGANAYASAFLDHREAEARGQQEELLASVEESLDAAREDLIAAEEAVANAEEGSQEAREAAADRQIADRSIQSLSTRRGDLQTMSFEPGSVLREAESASPASLTGGTTFLAGGVLASLVLALLAAFAREGLDKRVRTARDVGQAAHAPVLAEIPKSNAAAPLVDDPSGPAAEAYRVLRAQLLPALRRAGTRVIVVADEGGAARSGTAGAGLAVAIAQARHDVVLLMPGWPSGEAAGLAALDAGRPRAHGVQGYATLLPGAEEADGGEAVRPTSVPGLRAAHGDAAHALLAGEEGQALVANLAASGGYVVLDASGQLTRSEILTLAGLPGAVAIVVGQVGRSTAPELEALALSLERLGTPIAGCAVIGGRRASRSERSEPGDREDRGAPAGGAHRRVPPARTDGTVRA
ncbi:Wzz/FepE/Etk N-terminal domain-containing protein [Streptomyces sp. 6N223]|uniref:Wzz/FepE/Etk N-terminal domain-containing protein n=1 Tax=Streptomyces sp. 6N223 TaxID=3457412 RepID=UPI003FD28D3F